MRQRTCLGCRRVKAQGELVRFVSSDGEVRVDFKRALPGRGVYLCPSEACVTGACKRKDAFSRALRKKTGMPDAGRLWDVLKKYPEFK